MNARLFLAGMLLAWVAPALQAQVAETVHFPSKGGAGRLVAYLYAPASPGPHPAVVMLHGRAGLYSAGSGAPDAQALSSRHVLWARFWAARGYAALLVDSFGPRGYPRGFAAGTNDGSRPPEVNEITVRPLDAYGALDYLRKRGDVLASQVFLQGWSNGGSAALSAASAKAPGIVAPTPATGFRAVLSMYPACTQVTRHYAGDYATYTPLLLLIGSDDEEVRPENCRILAEDAKDNGSDVEFVLYEGAEHSYDTPSAGRRRLPANVAAAQDSMRRAEAFFRRHAR